MIATRIARRLMRKIAKPAALWWTNRQLAKAEQRANELQDLRAQVVPFELRERKRAVQLTAKRNEIQSW